MTLYDILSNQTMLDFTEVFPKGCNIAKYYNCAETIMQCTNIDFGHVWWIELRNDFYNNEKCMFHIIDNILDVNVRDNNSRN